jgi:hypothetical protein
VTLPRGQDPADAPAGFEERLGSAESYVLYRTPAGAGARRRPTGGLRPGARGARAGRGVAGASGGAAAARRPARPAARDARRPGRDRDRRRHPRSRGDAAATAGRRSARAGRTRGLRRAPRAREAARRALTRPLRRRALPPARAALVDGGEDEPDLVSLRAELDARAAREGLDVRTGTELLLRLRERRLRRELAAADLERTTELQASLARVRHAIAELA